MVEPELVLEKVPMQVKLVMVGNSGVGKTTLIHRFIYDEFTTSPSTLGAFFRSKLIQVPNTDEMIKFAIWDTAGQERFSDITKLYYKDAMAAIIVYDVTDPKSYQSLDNWLNTLKAEAGFDIVIGIAANKCDLVPNIPFHDALTYAKSNNALIQSTSAKDNKGVSTLFLKMATKIYPILKHREFKYSTCSNFNPFSKAHTNSFALSVKTTRQKKNTFNGKGGIKNKKSPTQEKIASEKCCFMF